MATKDELRLQDEYNDALKLSSSLTGAILKDIKEQIGLRTKLGKELQSEISSLEDSDDILKLIIKNENRITELSGVTAKNKVAKATAEANSLKSINKALTIEAQMVDIIKKVDTEAQSLSNSLSSALDGLIDDIKSVPVFGKMFGRFGDYASGIFKNKIGAAAQTFTTTFASNIRTMGMTGKGVMSSLSAAGSAAGSSLVAAFSGPQAIIAAIILAIGVSIFAFYKLSEATKAFRDETGLLNSQTEGLEQKLINVSKTTASLGASTEEIAKAAAAFTNVFDGLQQPSEAVVTSIITLNKNFGVSINEATKLNKIFQNIGNLSAIQSQALIGQTVSMADLAGVAPDKVIKDIADNSELAFKFFGGSAEELRNSAVEAAKLGTSLAEAGKVANNLLDFESSITKELEASAILGVSLNFGRARFLAATKDILGAQQAVVDEAMKLGDVTLLNPFEQEALATASNMTIESLSTQQKIRERFGILDKEQLASALAYAAAGKDISKLTEADLKNQTEELVKQKQMQSEFDNMKNSLSAMGTDLLMVLAPIGKLFVGILVPVFSLLKGFFVGIGKALTNLMSAFDNLLVPFREIFGDSSGEGFLKILEFIGELISGVVTVGIRVLTRMIDGYANTLGGVFKIIKGIFTLDFALIGEGLLQGFKGIIELMKAPLLAFFDFTVGLFDSFLNIFGKLGQQIKATISNMIPDWAKNLIGVGGVDFTSSAQNQKQGESMITSTQSINDGVVQNGQVVSTHPEDFLIATKNPAGLAESMSGGGPMISMEGVIKELRELKAAFLSNKDVYMDSTKVTTIVRRKTETSTDNKFGTQFA